MLLLFRFPYESFFLICTFVTQFVNSEPTVPLTSIPSIRFGAGFLARTFARFVKDLVDIAKDIGNKKIPKVMQMNSVFVQGEVYL